MLGYLPSRKPVAVEFKSANWRGDNDTWVTSFSQIRCKGMCSSAFLAECAICSQP